MTQQEPWVKYEELDENHGIFTAEPLSRGSGITLGNSLRRVLLSSLEGAAVSSVTIEGITHEYTTLPDVMEDVLDIIFNLKRLVLVSYNSDLAPVKINFKGEGLVTAGDIEHDESIVIVNPKQPICTLTRKGMVKMDLTIGTGRGYAPAELNKFEGMSVNTMPLDANFSPVVRVNHSIEPIRVGQSLDYDRLILEVWTNGAIKPKEAVKKASDILMGQLILFTDFRPKPREIEVEAPKLETAPKQKLEAGLNLSIEDLELSARSSNCLRKAGINTVAELIGKDINDLMQIKNFGRKSADEINEKLAQYGLSLRISDSSLLPEEDSNSSMVLEMDEVKITS